MTDSLEKMPQFHRLLSLPLAIIPDRVHSTAVITVLNQVFAGALQGGELDYLQDRTVCIRVSDMRLVSAGHLLVASKPIFDPSPETGLAKSR